MTAVLCACLGARAAHAQHPPGPEPMLPPDEPAGPVPPPRQPPPDTAPPDRVNPPSDCRSAPQACGRATGTGTLRVATTEPPPPPPPPPPPVLPEIPWNSGRRTMIWAPSATLGPSFVATRNFTLPGFDISVGVRHFGDYDPNPTTRDIGFGIATLGFLALPKSALLGNEHGVDLVSRLYWISDQEALLETALRPVLRVMTEHSRFSWPSALGTLLPAVGVSTLSAEKTDPHARLKPVYEAFLLRWSFDPRFVLVESPIFLFLQVAPTAEVLFPFDGSPAHATFGASLDLGFTVVEN